MELSISDDVQVPIQQIHPGRFMRFVKAPIYVITLSIDVLGLMLTLISLSWILFGESNLFTWHFASLLPAIIALSPIFALFGIFIRRRWFIFHALPAGLFIVLYGIFFIPRAPIVSADTPQLRVMTFNTQFRTQEAPKLAEIILEADADVIALQELTLATAEYFKEYLLDEYPYQLTYTRKSFMTQGKGLLSRYPLNINDEESLKSWHNSVYYQRVQIDFHGEVVTIVNTHPMPPSWGIQFGSINRSHHIDWIMEELEQESGAVVLLGDFNTTDQSEDYRQITAQFHDSVREVGLGLGQSFPDSTSWSALQFIPPLIRIDYVFHSPHLQAVSAGAWHESGGGDHRPVIANLILNPSA